MNKAKRSLIFSLLSLVFALAITATSTYAWFMVNTTVTASNMQVGVRSDTTYLVISSSSTLGTDTDLDLVAANVTAVLPARYTQTVTNNVVSNTEGQWQKGSGSAYDNGAISQAGYTNITSANEANHYVHFQFYVGVTSTTSVAARNLVVKDIVVTTNVENGNTTFLPAVSVLLKCGTTYINYTNNTANEAGLNAVSESDLVAKGVLCDPLAIGTGNLIDAYVYINGDNPVVTSQNATPANLGAFRVQIHFGCTEGAQA